MADGRYQLIALGLVAVALNISVNGIEACLPGFAGYVLIGLGAYQLRAEHLMLRLAWPLAGVLAAATLPYVVQDAMPGNSPLWSYYAWTWVAIVIADTVLLVMLIVALARQAEQRSRSRAQRAAWAALAVLGAGLGLWYVTMDTESALVFHLHLLIYFAPHWYLAVMFALAADDYRGVAAVAGWRGGSAGMSPRKVVAVVVLLVLLGPLVILPTLQSGGHQRVELVSTGDLWAGALGRGASTEELASLLDAHPRLLEAPVRRGYDAAHFAAHHGRTDALALLAAGGAQIDRHHAEHGMTPLMLAVAADQPDAVAWLLDRGADPHAAARDGRTAVDMARARDTSGVRQVFVDRGLLE